MTRSALLSATAALFFSSSAMAQEPTGSDQIQQPKAASDGDQTPVKLVSWDGDRQFMKTSRRMRVWRRAVSYTLNVDETGSVSDCKIKNEFDRTLVNLKLCEVLSEHHEFEPARDANDVAVKGSYSSRLVYADLRKK